MSAINTKMVFVSMSDQANGAENVLLMAARHNLSPIIFLKKSKDNALNIPSLHKKHYISNVSLLMGFIGLVSSIWPYRAGFTIFSTHSYLNAYLGFLKRIGYIKSKLVLRECTSVFTRYKGLKRWSYKVAYNLGYTAADVIICQTELMRNTFLSQMSYISPEIVIVIGNPIDQQQVVVKSLLTPKDIHLESDFICAAGRLIPEKGFSILIQAFKNVYAVYPNMKLLIFGDGPDREILLKLIKSNNLEGKVILKGWQSNIMPYFKKAKACVISSIKEGFPNALLEMLTLNPVVISTLCAGGIDTIPGIYKLPVNDVSDMTFSILKALQAGDQSQRQSALKYLANRSPEEYTNTIIQALNPN
jgi:glycosyltransferase involved in cell wall biosynthesis